MDTCRNILFPDTAYEFVGAFNDGRLYFTDPLIKLKRPALEVVEDLVGSVEKHPD